MHVLKIDPLESHRPSLSCVVLCDEVEEPSAEITLDHLSPHQRHYTAHIPSVGVTKTNLPEPAIFPT